MSLRQNALALIVLVAVLAIIGDWSTGAATRWWCLPAGLLLLGAAYEAAVVRRAGLQMQVLAPSRWLLGRVHEVRLLFRHQLARDLLVEFVAPAPNDFAAGDLTQTVICGPHAVGEVVLSATAARLGHRPWPDVQARVAGPLNLAWWSVRLPTHYVAAVVPDAVREGERAVSGAAGLGHAAANAGAGAEILQLRDYRPGDPPRVIDWKASARRGRLISRDFSEDQHLEIIIAVDCGRASGLGAGGGDRLGAYVNVAARLAQRAVDLDDEVGVLLFAAQPLTALRPARGAPAVVRIREVLSTCSVQPTESNAVLAAVRIRAMARHRALVVLLSDVDDASSGSQLASAVRLLTSRHFPFVASLSADGVQALAHVPALRALDAYRALAAQEFVNIHNRNVQALHRMGAAALTAAPSNLDAAVFEVYRDFRRRRRV